MGKKIYIGNLSFSTTEEMLSEEFSKFGQVDSVRIIMDRQTGASKGFGFVEMFQEEDAAKAITSLNGKNFDGRKLRVNYAEEKSTSTGNSSFSRMQDRRKKASFRDEKSNYDYSY